MASNTRDRGRTGVSPWSEFDAIQHPPKSEEPDISALDVQTGGSHYKDMVIQPIEFTMKNNLNFCQGNVIKYITRYKQKNGLEDLEKVKHYVDLLIELEGWS